MSDIIQTDAALNPGNWGESGVGVLAVEPRGPADRAGVLRSDVIVELGGQRVESVDDLHRLLAGLGAGKRVRMRLLRLSRLEELEVEPAAA